MAKKVDNRCKTDEQKFKGILGSVKYRRKCYPNEMAKALCLRYGIEDLKDWVQDAHMIDTIASLDSDIEIMGKYLYKNKILTQDHQQLFKGMDLKDIEIKKYCLNLAVRDMILSYIQGADIEELEGMDIQAQDTAESEVA